MDVGPRDVGRSQDAFRDIAGHYDVIMNHVSYRRWDFSVRALADLLPADFVHVDVGCGTGTLLKLLRKISWNGVGVDISSSMIREGRRCERPVPVAVGNMCALPFYKSVDLATCLFDSLNFVLDLEGLGEVMRQVSGALKEQGIFFFDTVTERMVTEHFEGQEWAEEEEEFTTTWSSVYDRVTCVAETFVTTSTGASAIIRERIYTRDEIEDAVKAAGFTILGVFDAQTWKRPTRKTVRVDYVVVKGSARPYRRRFKAIRSLVRSTL